MSRYRWIAAGLLGLVMIAFAWEWNSDRNTPHQGSERSQAVEIPEPIPALATRTGLPCERERLGYDLLLILSESHVQAALELTPDQRVQIQSQAHAFLQRAAAQYVSAQSAGSPVANPSTGTPDYSRSHGQEVVATLSPAQQQRLDQILFQLASVDIYVLPEISEALDATPTQMESILRIRQNASAPLAALRRQWSSGKMTRDDYEQQVHQMLVASEVAADHALNARQQSQLQAWRGPRIDFGRMHLRLGIQAPVRRTTQGSTLDDTPTVAEK